MCFMKLVYSYSLFYESLYIAIECFMKLVYSNNVFYESYIEL